MNFSVISGKEILHRLSHIQSGDQMSENLRSVDASPPHGVIGNLIELIPGKLGGHKIINSTLLHDLRKRSCVSEYIRQPENAVVHAEFVLKKLLSVHKLTYQRFP